MCARFLCVLHTDVRPLAVPRQRSKRDRAGPVRRLAAFHSHVTAPSDVPLFAVSEEPCVETIEARVEAMPREPPRNHLLPPPHAPARLRHVLGPSRCSQALPCQHASPCPIVNLRKLSLCVDDNIIYAKVGRLARARVERIRVVQCRKGRTAPGFCGFFWLKSRRQARFRRRPRDQSRACLPAKMSRFRYSAGSASEKALRETTCPSDAFLLQTAAV